MDVIITLVQLLIGQATILSTKDDSHIVMLRFDNSALSALSRRHQRPGNATLSSTGAHHQTAIGNSFIQRLHHHGRIENVLCAGSTPNGFICWVLLGLYQIKLGYPHIFYGTGGTANIARVTGIHQYHSNFLQQIV